MSFPVYNILKRKSVIVVPDFVGYFPFNGNVNDESGNGNNGTNNGATLTTDRFGNSNKAFDFDGINDFINIDDVFTNELVTNTKGTWCAWAKPVDATPTTTEYFISFADTDGNQRMALFILTTGELRGLHRNTAGVNWVLATDVAAFSDGVQTHISIVQDAISPILYVNGVAVAQTFSFSADKTSWFSDASGIDNGRIGDFSHNGAGEANFFDGDIDDIRIYDRDLSAAEVLEIYNSEKP